MSSYRVFTVGHGGRTLDDLLQQLNDHGIGFLIDIRSTPYSRYQPEFSQNSLVALLAKANMQYIFMGHQLGGRPDDPSCYTENGHVDYAQCRTRNFFRAGISRLNQACKLGHVVCLLCSESDPKDCHRSALIGVALEDETNIEVIHLLSNGSSKSQHDIIQDRTQGQLSFFGDVSRKAAPRYGRL